MDERCDETLSKPFANGLGPEANKKDLQNEMPTYDAFGGHRAGRHAGLINPAGTR